MKRLRETTLETKSIPQIGSQLSVEDRLKIIAGLIVDRLLKEQKLIGVIKKP